jgi:hypothetical protein
LVNAGDIAQENRSGEGSAEDVGYDIAHAWFLFL